MIEQLVVDLLDGDGDGGAGGDRGRSANTALRLAGSRPILLAHYRGSEIHNEVLHDESAAFADDRKYPESDHAAVVATFDIPT